MFKSTLVLFERQNFYVYCVFMEINNNYHPLCARSLKYTQIKEKFTLIHNIF